MKKFSLLTTKNLWVSLAVIALEMTMACTTNQSKKPVDLILHNGLIYTVDSAFSTCQALAVDKGRIIDLGTDETILEKYEGRKVIDLAGRPAYPGFYDAHCHFFGYGIYSTYANLVGTRSVREALDILKQYATDHPEGWIIGRGWDQNDWPEKSFPDRTELDRLFPDRPVFLKRIDGHAAWVNRAALDAAGITPETRVEGGKIIVKNGRLTGILIDNAVDLVARVVPVPGRKQAREALLTAQEHCFRVGLTTVDDAGLNAPVVEMIDSLQQAGALKMKIYAMLNPTERNLSWARAHGEVNTGRLHVRSFKFYADGALGSSGALLLQPYHDDPESYGLNLLDSNQMKQFAEFSVKNGFQLCTHCIGDSANREVLQLYKQFLAPGNDLRWRIEHAQVVHPDDLPLFGRYSIIPSVQPTHCTSDMYWAKNRLGPDRVKYAYAYQDLLSAAGYVAAGSDFPVEDINPLYGFYAAFARKDQQGWPENGFQKENALTREQALRAMTIWAARSNFEETDRGSLEPGKAADIVVLDRDIMTVNESEVFRTKVEMTIIDGEPVFQRGD